MQISSQLRAIPVASATLARYDSALQNKSAAALRTLVLRYQSRQKPVSVNFRRLLPALNSSDRLTHLIHPYPAKLLVHIPFFFLANDLLSKSGDLVLDPFCGSGTVLLEAQMANRRAYGVDANPLARLIARTKTHVLDLVTTRKKLAQLLNNVRSEPHSPLPDVVNIKHWFYPSVLKQLRCLREAIDRVGEPSIKNFLWVCFSVAIRKVSLADPRLSVPVRLKLGQYPVRHHLRAKSDAHLRRLRCVRVRKIFEDVAKANLTRMERLQKCGKQSAAVRVLCSDARCLTHEFALDRNRGKKLATGSVQLILTSPPYPGAQKYIRASSLSLGWLGLCSTSSLRRHKAAIIGREEFTKAETDTDSRTGIDAADRAIQAIRKRNRLRARIAETYLNDMKKALEEMNRVLKPGGYLILIAANNRISGRIFRTVNYLQTMAEESGLSLVASFVDAIRSRGLMTKRNETASLITREWVLIFAKGTLPKWCQQQTR